MWAVRLMHERELFGGRVGAEMPGAEPVMRAERVRSMRSSAAAAVEGQFEGGLCRSRSGTLITLYCGLIGVIGEARYSRERGVTNGSLVVSGLCRAEKMARG